MTFYGLAQSSNFIVLLGNKECALRNFLPNPSVENAEHKGDEQIPFSLNLKFPKRQVQYASIGCL
jgi:hypothetical protein